MDDEDRRENGPGRRHGDMPAGVAEDLGRLAAVAGARVSALEDIGTDLDRLTGAVDALANSIALMATKEEVEATERRLNRKRTMAILAVIAALILLALPVAFTRDTLEEVRDSGDYLIECTTPAPLDPADAIDQNDRVHECYDALQARQAAVVQSLNLSILDAAVCARTVEDPEGLEACFLDRLEVRASTPPPFPNPDDNN